VVNTPLECQKEIGETEPQNITTEKPLVETQKNDLEIKPLEDSGIVNSIDKFEDITDKEIESEKPTDNLPIVTTPIVIEDESHETSSDEKPVKVITLKVIKKNTKKTTKKNQDDVSLKIKPEVASSKISSKKATTSRKKTKQEPEQADVPKKRGRKPKVLVDKE
jgi:archaellin